MDCGLEWMPSHLQDTAFPHCPPWTLPLSLPVRGEDLGGPKGLGGPGHLHGRGLGLGFLHGATRLWPVGLAGSDAPGSAAEWVISSDRSRSVTGQLEGSANWSLEVLQGPGEPQPEGKIMLPSGKCWS